MTGHDTQMVEQHHLIVRMLKSFAVVLFAGLCSACTILPGLNLNPESDAEGRESSVPFTLVPITPSVIQELDERDAQRSRASIADTLRPLHAVRGDGYAYRVGPGDVLSVVVWEHPELTNPGDELRNTTASGRMIDHNGEMFFPYVGSFRAAGMTLGEVRDHIAEELERVIRDPQVDARVMQHRSQRVFVTGEVRDPGVSHLNDTARGVLDLVNEHGGLSESASRRFALLSRNGNSHLINLHELYAKGNQRHNIAMEAGDVLHVPDNSADKVFVLGQVGREGSVPIQRGYMSLTEALSEAQGLGSGSDDSSVFVFRSGTQPGVSRLCDCEPEEALVFGLDMSRVDGVLLAERFELQPRDVVYVSSTDFSRYNRIIGQILPTVSTLFQLERLLDLDR